MKFYYQIDTNGYVVKASQADDAPEPEPGCTVVESETRVPGDFWGPKLRFHWARGDWDDVRSLAEAKLSKWADIKAERAAREYGTYTTPQGAVFDIDAQSQVRLQNAYSLAVDAKAAGQPFSIEWTLANDSVVTLNANQMIALGKAVFSHINDLHATARDARQQILAATTVAEVEAIAWT
jgi:hypothetical protein